jgi:hypothetical protein
MRRSILPTLVLIAAAATAIGVTAAVTRTQDSSGVSRVERVVAAGWESSCDLDDCAIGVTQIPYTTPTAPEAVDVTVTITLDYRTTRGDAARAGLTLDDGTPPLQPMRPGSYPLRPTARRTTTTLTWLKKDLAAAGQAYTFEFAASLRFGDRHAEVSGRKLTVVIESWTAGD